MNVGPGTAEDFHLSWHAARGGGVRAPGEGHPEATVPLFLPVTEQNHKA